MAEASAANGVSEARHTIAHALLGIAAGVSLAVACGVWGFCIGGYAAALGLLPNRGGHGLGDLTYLFDGLMLGVVVGGGASLFVVRGRSARARLRVLKGAWVAGGGLAVFVWAAQTFGFLRW